MLLYIVLWLCVVYVTIKFCEFVSYQVKLYKIVKNLPGPEIQVPLFEHMNLLLSAVRGLTNLENCYAEISKMFYKYDNEHGIIRLWMGPLVPVVLVTDIKLIRRLFANHLNKSSHYRIFSYLLGNDTLITCNATKYKNYRIFLNPHFKTNAMDSYMSKTIANLQEMNQSIDGIIKKKDGELLNTSNLVSSFVFQTLTGNLFNIKFNSIANQKVPNYIETVFDQFSSFNLYAVWAQVFKWRIVIHFLVGIHQIFLLRLQQYKCYWTFLIELSKMTFEVHGRLKNAQKLPEELSLLESLVLINIIQKKSYFDKFRGYITVVYHGAIFITTGYISTTTAINDILYNLAKYPEVQKKLADEIDNFQQLLIENKEEMAYTKLKRLNYMNAVIKESLRLNSPLNFIGRMTSTQEVINDKMSIPANVDILISLQHILRCEKYFHDPERFYPERFLKRADSSICSIEQLNKQKSGETDVVWCTEAALIPFSSGIRMCPGRDYSLMQIKLFLINVLSKYSFELYGEVNESDQRQHITVQNLRYFGLRFYKRN